MIIRLFFFSLAISVSGAAVAENNGLQKALGIFSDLTKQNPTKANQPSVANVADLPPSPVDVLASDDMAVATSTGARWGAIAGAILAQVEKGDSEDTEKKMLIGLAVGAIAGMVAGDVAQSRREKFDSESAYLNAEISSANSAIENRSDEIAKYEKAIASAEKRAAKLIKQNANNKDVQKKAKKELSSLEASIEQNKTVLVTIEASIEYLDETLEESRQIKYEQDEDADEVAMLREDLQSQRDELSERYKRLHGTIEQGQIVASNLRPIATGKT